MTISAVDTVTTTLHYFTPPADGSKPYYYVIPVPSVPRSNWESVEHKVQIENLRGKEGTVSLDSNGFQYFNRPSSHKALEDVAAIEKAYYPESIALIKELTGASRVVVFDHSECLLSGMSLP